MRLDIDRLFGTKTMWFRYPRSVKIVGPFGWSATVPAEIKQAAIIQVVRWLKRSEQGFVDTAAIVELGQLTYTQDLDPDVKLIKSLPKFQRITI